MKEMYFPVEHSKAPTYKRMIEEQYKIRPTFIGIHSLEIKEIDKQQYRNC